MLDDVDGDRLQGQARIAHHPFHLSMSLPLPGRPKFTSNSYCDFSRQFLSGLPLSVAPTPRRGRPAGRPQGAPRARALERFLVPQPGIRYAILHDGGPRHRQRLTRRRVVFLRDRFGGMATAKTSQSHPLIINPVGIPDGGGSIGLTFCPGKKHDSAYSGRWDRDLTLDLAAIQAFGAKAQLAAS
jgi:hypothetical protein